MKTGRGDLSILLTHILSLSHTHTHTHTDQLDPTGAIFKKRFFRSSCKFIHGHYLKDLSVLGKCLSRVCLVDNNPVSFIANPSNGIPVPSFYDDPKDTVGVCVCVCM